MGDANDNGLDNVSRWAEDLEAWRQALRKLQWTSNDAWRERSKDDGELRMARKAFERARAKFEASDAAANEAQKKLDEMLAAGEKRGFRP